MKAGEAMDTEGSRMLHRHDQDLYRGNGLPGLTTRMAVAEDRIKTMTTRFNQIMVTLLAAILTGLADMAFRMVTGK
jgi:hypothetical protein